MENLQHKGKIKELNQKEKFFKHLKLTSGKYTLFVDNVYDNLNEIVTLFSSQNKTINLINNGEVTQNNLHKVYVQVFENIINQVVENKCLNIEESKNIIDNYIKCVETQKNNTKGIKNGKTYLSTVLKQISKNIENLHNLKFLLIKEKIDVKKNYKNIIKFQNKNNNNKKI